MNINNFIELSKYVANESDELSMTYHPNDPTPNVQLHFSDIVGGKTFTHIYTCEEIADFFANGKDAKYIVLRAHFLVDVGICGRCEEYDQDGYMRECMEVWTCESCFDDIVTAHDYAATERDLYRWINKPC